MSANDLIMRACEVYGFDYQRAFVACLELVVLRRRTGCNPEQKAFWMAAATDEQKREAHADAIDIISLRLT